MTIRSARGGCIAVRWAYGVFLTLCVALAVLSHHEMPSMDVSSMPDSAHAGHMMPVMPDETAPSVSGLTAHNADGCACSMPGMQHCTTANVDSFQLALPGQTAFDPLVNLRHAAAGRAPGAAAVGRAPPDLFVLSQLRI
ncbi:DUF6153 family protein [Streptomyces sp. NPDC054766]